MTLLADLLSTVFERRQRPAPQDGPDDRSLEELVAALLGSTGEVSGQSLASRILDRYEAMDDEGRLGVFRYLATAMSFDPDRVRAALDACEGGVTRRSYAAFLDAVEPPRQELIRRLNQLPGATGRLVRMRADLLRLGRGDPALEAIDLDFRHLFASWFNRGFLVLRHISWESSAHVLE